MTGSKQQSPTVVDRLLAGERVPLNKPQARVFTVLQVAAVCVMAGWPVVVAAHLSRDAPSGAGEVGFILGWYAVVALAALALRHDWGVERNSAMQFTEDSLHFWDWRGREHAIPWSQITEIADRWLPPLDSGPRITWGTGSHARTVRVCLSEPRSFEEGVRNALAALLARSAGLTPAESPTRDDARGARGDRQTRKWVRPQ